MVTEQLQKVKVNRRQIFKHINTYMEGIGSAMINSVGEVETASKTNYKITEKNR